MKKIFIVIILLIILLIAVVFYVMVVQKNNNSYFYNQLKAANNSDMKITSEAVNKLDRYIKNFSDGNAELYSSERSYIVAQVKNYNYYPNGPKMICPTCGEKPVVTGYLGNKPGAEQAYSIYCLGCGKAFYYYRGTNTYREVTEPFFGGPVPSSDGGAE